MLINLCLLLSQSESMSIQKSPTTRPYYIKRAKGLPSLAITFLICEMQERKIADYLLHTKKSSQYSIMGLEKLMLTFIFEHNIIPHCQFRDREKMLLSKLTESPPKLDLLCKRISRRRTIFFFVHVRLMSLVDVFGGFLHQVRLVKTSLDYLSRKR